MNYDCLKLAYDWLVRTESNCNSLSLSFYIRLEAMVEIVSIARREPLHLQYHYHLTLLTTDSWIFHTILTVQTAVVADKLCHYGQALIYIKLSSCYVVIKHTIKSVAPLAQDSMTKVCNTPKMLCWLCTFHPQKPLSHQPILDHHLSCE